jgi:flavodoxin
MHVLILYESVYGNTQKIAEAIGSAIENAEEVIIREISTIDPLTIEIGDCLIIGSPTHGFRPPPATHAFLTKLPKNALKDKMIAAFDTRMALSYIKSGVLRFIVKRGGYAASAIEKKLVQKGGVPIIRRGGFCVKDKEGPLLEGELERAKKWASNIKTWHTA